MLSCRLKKTNKYKTQHKTQKKNKIQQTRVTDVILHDLRLHHYQYTLYPLFSPLIHAP